MGKGLKTVAVVGASNDRRKFGNKAVRAFRAQGWTVIPITPSNTVVEGLTAYRSVLDVPGPIDMVTVYVQPEVARTLLREFQGKAVGEVWLNPGADDDDVLAEAKRIGLPVIAACSIIGIGRSPGDF
jgi:predicted CoA-binding protein